jgi:site-specific DNA recombinase
MKAAIYARKSRETEKGESLDNQISRGIALCNSRGWEYDIYQDMAWSGKSLDRPDFKRMYSDIENKKIHTVICYKLDRVSRNVNDFSSLINDLSSKNVDFISLTENFDTSSALGRAMMYISSVFAQLERETTAERVKDNMFDQASSGIWNGGPVPFGFDRIEWKEGNRKLSR